MDELNQGLQEGFLRMNWDSVLDDPEAQQGEYGEEDLGPEPDPEEDPPRRYGPAVFGGDVEVEYEHDPAEW
ncbi:hypothetical protein [Deinococcus cellulosilyticus]|uniref:Uncharacterized protein n=1 Tax=Deinococcus cellulosilyticus (strain DSM 18568 / NBRC 106333 / KACC 11606 / 5516J-15) TaxID=1223518 RepID=A0A511N9Y8_DEIC1|nr:hypothetical protein [Deinococcus cellulosilyticus]GEM49642.1 hypothetical protein DC3_52770 [Deinococcus cellulosilyticus NBRC 106333 = KACC 11606]